MTVTYQARPHTAPVAPVAPVKEYKEYKEYAELGVLVTRCREGDQRAWSELTHRFTPLVRSVARSFRLGAADCEDVCQLTWMQMVEGIRSVREPDRLRAWIATVARRESIKHLDRSRRQVPTGSCQDFDDLADGGVTPEERAIRQAEVALVRNAVRHLEPAHQTLLRLLFTDPPASYADISAQLGLPHGSIGPTRRRLLLQVKTLLDASSQD
ncbi:RNA polymerase sigma factor [Streptomyces spectabilis]|uniref:RNA polymerase sigma factor (Sigma-70 family) n=1 Tax=Streptomyces spectabilis TaxID=68270 RepID=A0A5P2X029_STRST|nr:sigma-70 family RNA polymerase sigma factor [Streptomyces spectabilis]MBB5100969.1 RNA polymerase sigma factor (sigma-70 family) [Streptomyces spectabilis]MCI3900182.1 sigma-70 family RNA polymerase sigma factor [Streptomyces spectabilis]QEV57791.1 sigma-70 family RNA polymerase sigma factor [Streptomyces spectabilis]GGV08764.1 RNA polymerase sigma factor [Streptomyces spectabilis]